jgi:hypothetical protein
MEHAMPDYQTYDDDINLAIRDTEREVFNAGVNGFDGDEDTDNQMVGELSQAEGWDGGDLPIEEVAHRNIYGDTSTNFDRPIAMDDELSLAAENERLRQERDAAVAGYNQYVAMPQLEAALQQRREQFREHMMAHGFYDCDRDPAKIDQLMAASDRMNQHAQALEGGRINASMAHAHAKYGRDFEDAYNDLTSMDHTNPLARNIVQHVTATADPGEALMRLHDNNLVQALGPSTRPPFMGSAPLPPHTYRPARPSASMDAGWGDWETENDVFNSAFDEEY